MHVVQFQLGPRTMPLPGIVVEADRLEEPEVASLIATGFYDRLLEGRGERALERSCPHPPAVLRTGGETPLQPQASTWMTS